MIDLREANLSFANLSGANLSMIDLSGANLSGANLTGANLSYAKLVNALLLNTNFKGANLTGAKLNLANLGSAIFEGVNFKDTELMHATLNNAYLAEADLSKANLYGAKLWRANLNKAYLSGIHLNGAYLGEAILRGANLSGAVLFLANLKGADLREVDLRGANLSWAILSEADLSGADLTGCSIYAIFAWNVRWEETKQLNLIISGEDEPIITVDNLEVAQFIYLLLNNEKIREVIDTITSKVVLILGRFTSERKAILDVLRNELRKRNYTPVLFDFEKPASRDITETVSTLAHMARFVIADITDAKSIPQELKTIVPNLPSVPVLPLILNTQHEYGMFEHFTRFSSVLPIYRYTDEISLLKSFNESIIEPAEQKAKDLAQH